MYFLGLQTTLNNSILSTLHIEILYFSKYVLFKISNNTKISFLINFTKYKNALHIISKFSKRNFSKKQVFPNWGAGALFNIIYLRKVFQLVSNFKMVTGYNLL